MRALIQDLRHGLRLLGRNLGFATFAALTLALGIGANVAIFSVIDAVLLRPLAYPVPERLMTIYSQLPGLGFDRFWVSPPEYLELRGMTRSFEDLGAYTTVTVNVSGWAEPLRAEGLAATASLLSTLGVPPERGRLFSTQDEVPNAEPVVLLGNGLWQRAFGGDGSILGKRIPIDGVAHTVIGIMPRGFDLAGHRAEVWLPLTFPPVSPTERGHHYLELVGRLRPAVSLQQARVEMQQILSRWPKALPDAHTPDPDRHRLLIQPLLDDQVAPVRPALRLVWLAVGLVLLIACANTANLLLARAESRKLEIALRAALGAGRSRLLRQFLVESSLLALLGGALGVLLAWWGVHLFAAGPPEGIPRANDAGIDTRELLFALGISLATGLTFGLAPALHARDRVLLASLREGRATGDAGRLRLQSVFVVAEVALAMTLMIGAGLLIRSFWALQQVDPGFRAEGVLSLQLSLPEASYPEPHQAVSFYRRLTEDLAALPGVQGAAAVAGLPPKRDVDANGTFFENIPRDAGGPPDNIDYWQFVTRDYYRVMKIPLVSGRLFTAADTAGSPGVVLINQTTARVFWPGRNPIGQRLRAPGDGSPWLTVVGVVKDVKQNGFDQKTGTEVYFLVDQAPETVGRAQRTLHIVLRTASDPADLASPVRDVIHRMDPGLPVSRVETMDQVVADSLARPRFLTLLVVIFAVIALVLAVGGVYSVLAYAVQKRHREIAIRLTLGAEVGEVLSMVMGRGARLIGLGVALGLALSFVLGRLLASLLFGVTSADVLTFIAVPLLLAVVGMSACYIPAQRAARTDPVTLLRQE